MANSILSKRTLIDKSNSTIVGVTAAAAFVIVFCLIASKSLISKELYQTHVINKKKTALSQLKSDVSASQDLVTAYKAFEQQPTNIIGGNPSGTGPQDGDNAKIILDALPSKYDFPALTTSIGDMIQAQGLKLTDITGSDDEVAQQSNDGSGSPQPIAMPFQVTVEGPYTQIEGFISELENSIRPFQVQTLTITGNQNDITATISAQAYYQPSKTLSITEETVK